MAINVTTRSYTAQATFTITGAPFISLPQFQGNVQWRPDRVIATWAKVDADWELTRVVIELGTGPIHAETFVPPDIPQPLLNFLATVGP